MYVDLKIGKRFRLCGRHGDYTLEVYKKLKSIKKRRGRKSKAKIGDYVLNRKTYHANFVQCLREILENTKNEKMISKAEDFHEAIMVQNLLIKKFQKLIYKEYKTGQVTSLTLKAPKKGKK